MKTALLTAAIVSLLAAPVRAKDVALVLNDQEQQVLYQALDEAVRSKGLAIAPNMIHLLQRLQSAPVVTEQKTDDPSKDSKQ